MNALPPAELEPEAGPDGVDPGKRLVRLGEEGGPGLAERLAERLERWTWRTPLHALRLKGRYPLKLLAVPDDPLLGVAARGEALLAGDLLHRGERRAVADLDLRRPDWGAPFAAWLHGFAWLRDLSTVATRARGAPVAEALMARWLDAHGEAVAAPAWTPDLAGRRVLFWCAHAPLILSSADLVYRSRVLNALARTARYLDRAADGAPPGAGRVAAWAGVVTAGLLLPGGEGRRAGGEAGLARALAASQFDDGGSVTRSPAVLMDTVALLAMLRAAYDARRVEPPEGVAAALARMVAALLGTTCADRGLGSWQGGRPVAADRLAQVVAASGVRTRPLRQARDWGYQRLAGGGAVLVMDAAPPPTARAAAGGCASTLAFEFSDGAHRLVVNCGGAGGAMAGLPAGLAEGLRSTAAHSTLVLAETNSTAVLAGGLGRGVAEVQLARQEGEGGSRIEASHDGWARRWGLLHRRQLLLAADGRELRGEDVLLPRGRGGGWGRARGAAPFAVRFHLGAGVTAAASDPDTATLRLPDGALWQFRCRGGALGIEPSLWIDPDGRPVATSQLVVAGEAAAGGASVSWALKRVA